MRKYNKGLFFLIVFLQILALFVMIAKREHLLRSGMSVKLKCEPIDPRSLLSGDFVNLNYNISRIQRAEVKSFATKDYFRRHDTVYVALVNKDKKDFWDAVAYSDEYSTLTNISKYIIKGKLENTAWEVNVEEIQYIHNKNYKSQKNVYVKRIHMPMRLTYGIEQYFVPQREGRKLERNISNAEVSVEVAITRSGQSALKKLFINNKEIKFH